MCILIATAVSASRVRGEGQPSFAVNCVVPAISSNVDGNTYSGAGPAVNQPQTIRYQQIYAASEFTFLTNSSGGWLTIMHFRGDATNGTQIGLKMPSVQVNLSTIQRGPDELSTVFSENVGPDDTVIFSGQLETVLIGGHRDGPETFVFEIWSYSKLFFYNPKAGNLLLDVHVFRGNTNGIGIVQPVFDAVNVTNDSVSRVWWGDVNASTGLVETIGLPTELTFWPNPKLSVQLQTNSVTLSWPVPIFLPALLRSVLQSSQRLFPQPQWEDITNGIVTSNFVSTYTLRTDSAGAATYFRLVSITPP